MMITATATFACYRVSPECYACDAAACGTRDRRPEGGEVETACARHREPGTALRAACMYCKGTMRRGGMDVDGDNAHANCHRDASR